MTNAHRFLADDLGDLVEIENSGSPGLISELIQDFKSQLDEYLGGIDQAQKAVNYVELKRHSHSLKSSTRVLGLRATSLICEEIEKLADAGSINPLNLDKLRAEIFPALEELATFEQSRKKV